MSWMLILAATWALLSAPLALLAGRMIRLADTTDAALRPDVTVPDFVPAGWVSSSTGTQ